MAAKPKQVTRRITVGDVIRYEWMDKTPGGGNLGHAEFLFCPVWSRGRMRELHIYPRQQRVPVYCYTLDLSECRISDFSFSSWTYMGIEHPWCWRMWWCKEHKGVSYEVYVPKNTSQMSFELYFGNSIEIRFDSPEASK